MIAIIPARGGSKGLPGKNIRELAGKPLISYSIMSAMKADCIDRVLVTTDDEKIAKVAESYGAEIPFIRPPELATDNSSAVDVYIHAVEYMINTEKCDVDSFMVLLPTAPLRTSHHIMEAYDLFVNRNAATLISVVEAETPPSWYMQLSENGMIQNCGFGNNENAISNRQNNKTYYIPNGAIYILNYNLLKSKRTYYCDKTIGYVMSRCDSVDIDTLDDFDYAEYLLTKSKG